MDTCEVLIVGGGPAGSACAWRLRQAGLDVAVIDKAIFPRDKVCAGWITPQVVDDLQIDLDEYKTNRTLQAITGFRVGVIGSPRLVHIQYDRPVSYGIRRCEFDQYLLQRSGARLLLDAPVASIRRDGSGWIVDGTVRASMLVGAGGHFCPVGRMLNGPRGGTPLVVAQEAEFPIDAGDCGVSPDVAELYFCPDLDGYGWCVRKQNYLNIGLGRLDAHALPKQTAAFVAFLTDTRFVPRSSSWSWRGHAYLLAGSPGRRLVDDRVLLVGDSAGLAYAESGEGIRPAIESGLLAASAIVENRGQYGRDRLESYVHLLQRRLGVGSAARRISSIVPRALSIAAGRRLLTSRSFVRHVVIDRWFLHRRAPALA